MDVIRHSITLKPNRHVSELLSKENLLSEEDAAVADWKEKIEAHFNRMDEILEEMRRSNSEEKRRIDSYFNFNGTGRGLFQRIRDLFRSKSCQK